MEQKKIIDTVGLPDFKIDVSKIPLIKIKSITFKNFKVFKFAHFNFINNKICQPFVCFIGPNGCGKTTILDAISIIFSRIEGYDEKRLKALLGKSVRHEGSTKDELGNYELSNGIYGDGDFNIKAEIQCSIGDYSIEINKSGFVKDHPEEVKNILYRLQYFARFDQELHQFQLDRKKWKEFKDIFEAVTGFEIEEYDLMFNESVDPVQSALLKQYILGFVVHKPNEIIRHTECSAGERKIIKTFSTLLNKEYLPSIICVDNVEMHVESGRHIYMIESIKKCFPTSQIFTSTHSYQISKNFGNKNQIYDLRLLKTTYAVEKEPWRLYIQDEIRDAVSKLKSIDMSEQNKKILFEQANMYTQKLLNNNDLESEKILQKIEDFLNKINSVFLQDIRNISNNNISAQELF